MGIKFLYTITGEPLEKCVFFLWPGCYCLLLLDTDSWILLSPLATSLQVIESERTHRERLHHRFPHPAQSDLDNRCVWGLYEMEGVRASWIFIMTSPVYWLWYGGHTQVRLSGLQELGREEGGSILIAHIRDIKESAGSRQLDRWRWVSYAKHYHSSNWKLTECMCYSNEWDTYLSCIVFYNHHIF